MHEVELESISFFKQAIDHDPDYALAYSGLSDSYALQVDYRSVPVTEGYRLAREYALRALALDQSLPEAHTSLAWVLHVYDWDRSEEHTSELQSRLHLVCRLLLEKKKKNTVNNTTLNEMNHVLCV